MVQCRKDVAGRLHGKPGKIVCKKNNGMIWYDYNML